MIQNKDVNGVTKIVVELFKSGKIPYLIQIDLNLGGSIIQLFPSILSTEKLAGMEGFYYAYMGALRLKGIKITFPVILQILSKTID